MSLLNSWDGNNFRLPDVQHRPFEFAPFTASSVSAPEGDLGLDIPDVGVEAPDVQGLEGTKSTGVSPGRTRGMQVASALTPGPLGMALGLANSALGWGAQSFNQNAAGLQRSALDSLGESFGLTGYSGGIGGYGQAGMGGYTGAMDYSDPGVAGPARGIANSAVASAIAAANAGSHGPSGYGNIGDADADHDSQQADLSDPNADVSAPDTQNDGLSGADSDSDSGDSVICTELYRQGFIDADTYNADAAFGCTLPDYVINGYHLWAKPVVRIMRRSGLVTRVVRVLAMPIIRDMVKVTEGAAPTRRLRAGIWFCGFVGMNEARALDH